MKIVILGNGISGITAARHIRKMSAHEIVVISGESDYFFSRTALMYVYMGQLKMEHTQPYENWFWEKNKIQLKKAWIERIDFDKKQLYTTGNEVISYDKLILATGSVPNKFGWKGQELKGVQGLYSLQDLENLERISDKIETAVIVGGGLIGVELAEMLLSRRKKVVFLVREKSFWDIVLPKEESELITNHIRKHQVDVRLATELEEIIGNENGEVIGIKTKSGETISCQFVGLTVGVRPNIDFLKNTNLATDKGILVNEFLETNVNDVFAVGDCVQHQNPPANRKNLEQIWYTGRIMGKTVAQTICQHPTKYEPGMFFNSAKFFDIEYQTYGIVSADNPVGTESFVWQNVDKEKVIRINYEQKTKAVSGVNTFGVRMRQEVWERWIAEKKSIEYVIENLKEANFDPEFYRSHWKEIKQKWG